MSVLSYKYTGRYSPDSFKKIINEYNLDKIIEDVIGKYSGLFLNLVSYSIITENNAGQYYPDYAYNHALFTNDMIIYSDSKVSEFLNSITDNQNVEFLNEWNRNRNHKKKYIFLMILQTKVVKQEMLK